MKTFSVLFVIVICLSTNNFSQVLLEENFDYPEGDTLTNHGWIAHSGAGSNPITVVSPGLTFPGQPGSGIGNAAGIDNTGEDVHKLFTSVTSGAVYTSFMVQVSSLATGGYFLHYAPNPHSSDYRGRVWANVDITTVAFGLSFGSGGEEFTLPVYLLDETYLIVVKYEIVVANDDSVSIYIFYASAPPPIIEPGIPDVGPLSASGTSEIEPGSVNLRQFLATQGIVVDGILVSSTWSDVVPVELTSFTASVSGNSVTLNWTTATELNNSGFDVLRQSAVGGQNDQCEKIGFVPGIGTSTEKHSYSFVDENLTSGQYSYRLKQIDYDGTFELSDLVNVEVINPTQYSLSQNYPNPFNPVTIISYSLPQPGNVAIKVYDVLGNEVAILLNEEKSAGRYEVNWHAKNNPSGVYTYRIEAGEYTEAKKMVLLK